MLKRLQKNLQHLTLKVLVFLTPDESLRKWKESLGLKAGATASSDPRKVVVLSLAMEVAGRGGKCFN